MLVAEYGGLAGKRPGTIKVLDLESGDRHAIYPPSGETQAGGEPWGDPSCTEEIGAAFAPHGVHLSKGPGGRDRLLVVNHGERESIEFFELAGADTAKPTLMWRGCVVAPDPVWLNDVAGLPGGAFVASHMAPRGTSVEDLLRRAEAGEATGHVVVWTPDEGWSELPGSAGILPNGVQTSEDGNVVFANYFLANEVVAIDRATGERLWTTTVRHPDNSSWAPDGRLLVASIRADLDPILECVESDAPFCPLDYGVVAIDPATGATTTLAEGGGPPFGMATVAVQVGPRVYLGSATGERIGVVEVAN